MIDPLRRYALSLRDFNSVNSCDSYDNFLYMNWGIPEDIKTGDLREMSSSQLNLRLLQAILTLAV